MKVSFHDRPQQAGWSSDTCLPAAREKGIQSGSWSGWAIGKVVVSRADGKWPNVIARIIARFFIDPDDAAEFLGVERDSALAILGRRPSGDTLLRADAEEFARSGKRLRDMKPSVPERIRAALYRNTAVTPQNITRIGQLSEMIDACGYADGYIERAEAYLDRGDYAGSICAALVNDANASDHQHRLYKRYGIVVEIDEIDPPTGTPDARPAAPAQNEPLPVALVLSTAPAAEEADDEAAPSGTCRPFGRAMASVRDFVTLPLRGLFDADLAAAMFGWMKQAFR